MKTQRSVLFLISILLIAALISGCGSKPAESGGPKAIEEKPTATPPPVEEAAPQSQGGEAQAFFAEEFDAPLSDDWTSFLIYDADVSDPEKAAVEAKDGKLSWNIDSKLIDSYLFYNAYSYDDVKIQVHADNRGVNNTMVSLVCRADPEVGWYQFSVTSGGLYEIRYIENLGDGKFRRNHLTNGGSLAIKQGKGVNEYTATCQGDRLTLHINGEKVASLQETNFAASEGQIGFAVSSPETLPAAVQMEWLKVSAP
jgi:hypothetical protein